MFFSRAKKAYYAKQALANAEKLQELTTKKSSTKKAVTKPNKNGGKNGKRKSKA